MIESAAASTAVLTIVALVALTVLDLAVAGAVVRSFGGGSDIAVTHSCVDDEWRRRCVKTHMLDGQGKGYFT